VTTYTCPKGHASTTDDFCDTCGARIGGTMPITVPAAVSAGSGGVSPVSAPPATSRPAAGVPCPNCGTPRTGNWRFCEDCGFDHTTGKVPTVDTEPATLATALPGTGPGTGPAGTSGPAARPVAGQWTATVGPDRGYFDANAIEGVEFPADAGIRTVGLPAPQVRIGRKSRSKGTDPELDLSAEPLDPGVSHSHALLTLNIDGVWLVSDLGSTNGTYVNDEAKPLTAGQTRTLADGDRVHVGAWTTITLHAPV
jgi:FHA domain-containing protein/double zinc ribbon protein